MRDDERVLVFLGRQNPDAIAHTEAMEQHVIRVNIQLLLHLTLHVRCALRPEDIRKTGAAHLGFDHLGGEGDSRKEPGELARSGRKTLLPLKDMLLNGSNRPGAEKGKDFGFDGCCFHWSLKCIVIQYGSEGV